MSSFLIGQKVSRIAFTDCFGVAHAEVSGLTVTRIQAAESTRGVANTPYTNQRVRHSSRIMPMIPLYSQHSTETATLQSACSSRRLGPK